MSCGYGSLVLSTVGYEWYESANLEWRGHVRFWYCHRGGTYVAGEREGRLDGTGGEKKKKYGAPI